MRIGTCKSCEREFLITRVPNRRGRDPGFCSPRCRAAARAKYRRLHGAVCEQCQCPFETRSPRQRFCSLTCSARASAAPRRAAVLIARQRMCAQCNRQFTLSHGPSGRALRGEVDEGRFCSRRCAAAWRSARVRASKAAGDLFELLAADPDRPLIFACALGDKIDAAARDGQRWAIDQLIKMRPPDVPAALRKKFRDDAIRSIYASLAGMSARRAAEITAAAFEAQTATPPWRLTDRAPFNRLSPQERRSLQAKVRAAVDDLGTVWPNWRQILNIVQH